MKNIISNTTTSARKFLKTIISMLSSMAKAKSLAIRDRTNGLKARLIVLSLLRNKKFSLGSITHKIEAILNHKREDAEVTDEEVDRSKAIVNYNASVPSDDQYHEYYYNDYENDNENKYPDLRHSLFDDEMDLGDPNGSVIDLVKNSKEEGEHFKLENEIDHVADLFILKFHKTMKLQKLESFKRYQEMLQRGA